MEKDSKKSYTERVNELENIVHGVVHVPRSIHMEHLFPKKDVYHHGCQEIRVLDYVTRHAYSLPERLKAKVELFYLWSKEIVSYL